MLAATGAIAGDPEDWVFEPKFDGWRCLLYVVDGNVTLRTRTGRDATDAVPELAPVADALGSGEWVLDGELVANEGTAETFYALGGRMAAKSRVGIDRHRVTVPLTFVAFDLLWSDGDRTAAPYKERRAELEGLGFVGPTWATTPTFPGLGAELFAACTALGLEGLVAKKPGSPYRPGQRSSAWVKAKTTAWKTAHAPLRHE